MNDIKHLLEGEFLNEKEPLSQILLKLQNLQKKESKEIEKLFKKKVRISQNCENDPSITKESLHKEKEELDKLVEDNEKKVKEIFSKRNELEKDINELKELKNFTKTFKIVNNQLLDIQKKSQKKIQTSIFILQFSKLLQSLNELMKFPSFYEVKIISIISILLNIQKVFEEKLKLFLDSVKWGKDKEFSIDSIMDRKNEFCSLIIDLFQVQLLQLHIQNGKKDSQFDSNKRETLYVIRTLTQKIRSRFLYHFYGDKETNDISKPEYIFSFTNTIFETYVPIITLYVHPMYVKAIKLYNNATKDAIVKFIDPVTSFINSINMEVAIKIKRNLLLLLPYDKESEDDKENGGTVGKMEKRINWLERHREKRSPEKMEKEKKKLFMKIINETIDFDKIFGSKKYTRFVLVKNCITLIVQRHNTEKNDDNTMNIVNFWINSDKDRVDKETCDFSNWNPYVKKSLSYSSSFSNTLVDNIDEQKPSISTYSTISILSVLNERYKVIGELSVRYKFFEKIHFNILEEFLVFFSKNLNKHLPDVDEEKVEWVYFIMMINSAIYMENNLKLWEEMDFVLEFQRPVFMAYAERFIICADKMTRTLSNAMMECVKIYFANTYERLMKKNKLTGNEAFEISEKIKKQINVVQKNLRKIRFNKVWRILTEECDLFFYIHFDFKVKKNIIEGESEKRKTLVNDIRVFVENVFSECTDNPLNFLKKMKYFLQ